MVPKAAVGRKLSLEEKAVVLGCAVSIDFDFFSRHSGGGIPLPFIMPFPGKGTRCPFCRKKSVEVLFKLSFRMRHNSERVVFGNDLMFLSELSSRKIF